MIARYSRVLVDSTVGDLWFLGGPYLSDGRAVDARLFTRCETFANVYEHLSLPIQRPGRVGRLTFGAFDMPVVDRALADSFSAGAGNDIQLVPAAAEDGTELFIVNVLPCVDCIDETKTVGEKWTARDGRPDRIGRYRTIVHLFIDPNRVHHDIFRVSQWKIALIVSDRFADVAGLAAIEGIRLEPVTWTAG